MIDRAGGASLSPLGEFGWSGVLSTYMAADPLNRLAIVYAMQISPDDKRPPMQQTMRNLVYAALEYENVLK